MDRRILRLFVVACACALLLMRVPSIANATTPTTTGNSFTVDADANTPGIQSSITALVGTSVTVSTVITAAPDPYIGYQSYLQFDPSILSFTSGTQTVVGNLPLCTPGIQQPGLVLDRLYEGCISDEGVTQDATGDTGSYTFECLAPGTVSLHLVTYAEDNNLGTYFFLDLTTNAVGPTIDATVRCTTSGNTFAVDADANTPGIQPSITALVGTSFTGATVITAAPDSYNVYQSDIRYDPSTLSPSGGIESPLGGAIQCSGVVVFGDESPPRLFEGCLNPSTAQTDTGETARYTMTCIAPGTSALHLLSDAEVGAVGTDFGLGPPQSGIIGNGPLQDASVSCVLPVTKTDDASGIAAPGSDVTYAITVANRSGGVGSTIAGSITDTIPAPLTYVSDDAGCTGVAVGASGTLTCATGATNPSTVVHVTVHVPLSAARQQDICNSATFVDDLSSATPVQLGTVATDCIDVQALPVRMDKDLNGVLDEPGDGLANLWLCTAAACPAVNGDGYLDIGEYVANADGDAQGVGAFEFELGYDNRAFDVSIDGGGWLYSTGRVRDDGSSGDAQAGGCNATVITEDDMRFGCVSENPASGATGCPAPDDVTIVDEAECGPATTNANPTALLATIHVTPRPDLIKRLTPGNDNGVIRTLLDQGCELADIWGHPLSSGFDALGRPIPLAGTLPGGQVADCGNLTITVRILEGDMNTDCTVDVADDQIEAAHYGASFGSLLYDPWYDLEPALKDGDVDVKDLQKVFGRNGSTCAAPVPPQDPLPQPGDP